MVTLAYTKIKSLFDASRKRLRITLNSLILTTTRSCNDALMKDESKSWRDTARLIRINLFFIIPHVHLSGDVVYAKLDLIYERQTAVN